jgi:thymidylate synthase
MSQLRNNIHLQQLFDLLRDLWIDEKFVQDKTGVKTVELIDHQVNFDPNFPLLDVGFFKTSEDYVKRELDWYLSEDLSIHPHMSDIKIWGQVCSSRGMINSNYGFTTFSEENGHQYRYALETLKRDKTSRRAVIQYNRPNMVEDYNKDGMSDYICTIYVNCLIRDDTLIYMVRQRSCDLRTGLPNDLAWHCYVYQRLLKDLQQVYPTLRSQNDSLHFTFDSLHLYERNFKLFEKSLQDIKETT